MTEGKRVSLNEVFERKRRELTDYYNSPEGQESRRIADEKSDQERRRQSLINEGTNASISGKQLGDCPYLALSTESRLWIYGFENSPPGEDEEGDEEHWSVDDETD